MTGSTSVTPCMWSYWKYSVNWQKTYDVANHGSHLEVKWIVVWIIQVSTYWHTFDVMQTHKKTRLCTEWTRNWVVWNAHTIGVSYIKYHAHIHHSFHLYIDMGRKWTTRRIYVKVLYYSLFSVFGVYGCHEWARHTVFVD